MFIIIGTYYIALYKDKYHIRGIEIIKSSCIILNCINLK